MSLNLVVTSNGRAALRNAENDGTNAVVIAEIGVSATAVAPSLGTIALAGELKRLETFSGEATAPDIIHISIRDASDDAYDMRSFALYLDDGTLFAVYGQPAAIVSKSTTSQLYIAFDIQFADVDASELVFGDTTFVNPAATEEVAGVIEIASDAENIAGADGLRATSPKGLWATLANWLTTKTVWGLGNDGAGSGLDADLLDGYDSGYFLPADSYTAADVKTKLLTVDGAGSGVDADLLDGRDSAEYVLHTDAATEAVAGVIEIASDAENIAGADGLRATSPKGLWATLANWLSTKTVWGLSNDGAGSGLDADLLDGYDSSAIVLKANIMADFAAAMNETGSAGGLPHYEFEFGDMLVQMGWALNVTANNSAAVAFPRAFSAPPWAAAFRRTSGAVTDSDSGGSVEGTPTTAGMTVRNTTAGGTIDIPWIAIGKK
jgi:hypothetical protein